MAQFEFLLWEPGHEFPVTNLQILLSMFKKPISCIEVNHDWNCIAFYTRNLKLDEDAWEVLARSIHEDEFYVKFHHGAYKPFSGTTTQIKKYIKQRKEQLEAEQEAEEKLEQMTPVMDRQAVANFLEISQDELKDLLFKGGDFPQPFCLSIGDVWKTEDVQEYARNHNKEQIS